MSGFAALAFAHGKSRRRLRKTSRQMIQEGDFEDGSP